MYKSPKYHQISFYDFNQSCGLQLDETNEWIVLADPAGRTLLGFQTVSYGIGGTGHPKTQEAFGPQAGERDCREPVPAVFHRLRLVPETVPVQGSGTGILPPEVRCGLPHGRE